MLKIYIDKCTRIEYAQTIKQSNFKKMEVIKINLKSPIILIYVEFFKYFMVWLNLVVFNFYLCGAAYKSYSQNILKF